MVRCGKGCLAKKLVGALYKELYILGLGTCESVVQSVVRHLSIGKQDCASTAGVRLFMP